VASTFAGELRRNFNIGQNQGELAFDAGSVLVGGPLAKSVKEVGLLSKAASYEKSIAQGLSPAAAEHLSQPYVGKGHHSAFPQRTRLPALLGGGPLPRSVMESQFNRLAPPGMTRGEFYERHFRVDPHFYGAGLPKALKGESWSGRKLGLKRYGFAEQLWHGTPAPLKARIGGLAAGVGGLLHSDPNEEE